MATCYKCGGPIWFKVNENGKFVPISVNGGDHWDECREWQHNGTYGIRKERGPDMIGPVWTPGHGTEEHAKRIGLDRTDTSIPFDPPYV